MLKNQKHPQKTIETKIKMMAYVNYDKSPEDGITYFNFNKYTLYQSTSLEQFLKLVKANKITYELVLRIDKEGLIKVVESRFRCYPKYLKKLYSKHVEYNYIT